MKFLLPLLASSTLLALPIQGAIVADFESGTGTDTSAQFPGAAGNGWLGPWQLSVNTGDPSSSQALATTDPITGAGSLFLTSTTTLNTNGNASRRNAGREFDASTTTPFTVLFDFRIDEITGTNSFGDFVTFFLDGSYSSTGNYNNSVGGIRVRHDGALQYRDSSGAVTVGTGTFAVADDTAYRYEALIDPTAETWDLTVTNLSNPTEFFSVTGLGGDFAGGFDTVHFGTSVNNQDVDPDPYSATTSWTVDNFDISLIPEPSTGVLLLLALGLAAFRRQGRR